MTRPTADAAKMLPCPFPWRGDNGSRSDCIKQGHCGCGYTTAEICDAIAADPPSAPSDDHDDWQHGWQDGAMACAAEIRARTPAPQEDGWQPIESAPKDGTVILLSHSFYTLCGYESKMRPLKKIAIGYYDGNWLTGVPGGHSCGGGDKQFTHWRPLPAPPSAREGE